MKLWSVIFFRRAHGREEGHGFFLFFFFLRGGGAQGQSRGSGHRLKSFPSKSPNFLERTVSL